MYVSILIPLELQNQVQKRAKFNPKKFLQHFLANWITD